MSPYIYITLVTHRTHPDTACIQLMHECVFVSLCVCVCVRAAGGVATILTPVNITMSQCRCGGRMLQQLRDCSLRSASVAHSDKMPTRERDLSLLNDCDRWRQVQMESKTNTEPLSLCVRTRVCHDKDFYVN